jgi:glycosyltransferase involved in cell wall biosynthesis
VLVQPSHWEGAPFGVVEAMATGLPIVATRVGGMAEYLVHDANALVVEPHDPAGLSRQLARAIEDAALRRRLGEAGRALAEEQFDERVVCARYEALFERLIAQRVRPQDALRAD